VVLSRDDESAGVVGGGRMVGLKLEVKDDGTGIPPEIQKKVFTCFFRGHYSGSSSCSGSTTTTTDAPGHGLGLAITKELVELMRGRIHLDSTVGVGSVFTVTIGLEEVCTTGSMVQESGRNQEENEDMCLKDMGSLRILSVEDLVPNQMGEWV